MTTLPQTTTVRLPRMGGPSPLALPGGGPGGMGGNSGSQLTGADVWRIIRANIWLIIIMVVIAGTLGFIVNSYLARNYPRYTAVGLIQVQTNTNFDPLQANQTNNLDRLDIALEQRTQAQLLKHQSVISQVLQKSERIRDTSWFKQFQNVDAAKEDLMDNFSVQPIPETKLISISMTYSNPSDCKAIVEEVVDEHIRGQGEIARDRQLKRSMLLNEMRIRYEFRQSDLTEQLRQKAAKLSIDLTGASGHLNARELELMDLVKTQLDLQNNADLAKGAYDNAVSMTQNGQDIPEVEETLNRDPAILGYKQAIDTVDAQISENEKLGPDHPYMMQLLKRREVYRKKYDDLRAETGAKARAATIDKLRNQVAGTQQSLNLISQRIADVRKDMAGLTNDMAVYLTLKDEDKTVREELKDIKKSLDDIQQFQNRADQSAVIWSTRPEKPSIMSFPKLPMTMTLAIALGLGISLGIAFLREMMDTSIRSPRDIARVGQMNLLGMICDENDDPQSAGARLPMVIFEAPTSIMAEQFRQVRTRLQHTASLDTTRSILVTSPSPGDGKSTIAANLATGLALNGRRILFVDANFRRPELHKIFALSNEHGFGDALNAPDTLAKLVQETQIPNLSVLACGPKPSNATELLESQLLIDFIEHALESYDHIIFDSGPLLFASESVALAPRVDGVVTVVRAQANSRGVLQRMRDSLRQIKASHVGVVLNGVRAQGGGYYGSNIKTYYEYQNDA